MERVVKAMFRELASGIKHCLMVKLFRDVGSGWLLVVGPFGVLHNAPSAGGCTYLYVPGLRIRVWPNVRAYRSWV